MIIAADLGNTRLKLGLFEAGQLIDVLFLPYTDLADGLQRHPRWEEIRTQTQYLGMASVKKVDMATALLEHFRWLAPDQVIQITHQSRFPIENAYRTPHTLGMDRLCAAAGAYAQVGKGPLLVIDAGTALTYEFVDAEGRYQGGGITPGLRTRFHALHDYTAALPLVEAQGDLPLVGYSTETSIRSGVLLGLVEEIQGMMARYREAYQEQMPVFLTGGDTGILGNHLKKLNFADAHLLLRGIYTVILHNVSIS